MIDKWYQIFRKVYYFLHITFIKTDNAEGTFVNNQWTAKCHDSVTDVVAGAKNIKKISGWKLF